MSILFKSREEKIVEIERIVNERPELLKKELRLLLYEYDALLTSLERINKALNDVSEKDYLAKNRRTLLGHVFSTIEGTIKVCEEERNLGKNPQHARFAQLLGELIGRLKEFKSYFVSGIIHTKFDATSVFTRSILGHVKDALIELRREIENEKQRANGAAKSPSRI
jgi:hypothetical protein